MNYRGIPGNIEGLICARIKKKNSLEFREVVRDVAVRYFLLEQVHFVEKQDDRDVLKYNVVHNRLEDVP